MKIARALAQITRFAFLTMVCVSTALSCSPQDRGGAAKVPRYFEPQTRVLNPGFELGAAYWKTISSGVTGVKVSADSNAAFAGKRSLKIDLQNMRRLEKDGAFYLLTPWLTLQGGGRYSFALHLKSNRPRAKVIVRVFNATSKEGLESGEQQFVTTGKDFVCTESWSRSVSAGDLPLAEQDNYRFAIKFSEPAIYWIDQAEILHNEQACTHMPEIEAVLQPAGPEKIINAAAGKAHARLQIANHSARQRRLRLSVKQNARLQRFAPAVEREITVAPQQLHTELIKFEVPFADVYELQWELRDENSSAVQRGQTRLAAMNSDLPRLPLNGAAANGEPVWGMHLNSTNLETNLPLLQAAGIRRLRNLATLHWELVEPQPGQWQWPDSLLDYLHAQDFHVLGKLGFTPKWAVPPDKAKGWPTQNKMPRSLEEYRNYVRTVLARYGSRIHEWEVWNEVNLPRYFDGTPDEYASLLQTSIAEIKNAQPSAEVAGFAFARFYAAETMSYLADALDAQPAIDLEAISFHPYTMKSPEEIGLVQRLNQMRQPFQPQKAREKPAFWITEYGCQNIEAVNTALAYHPPLRPLLVNEITYAAYLVRTACLSRSVGVKYFFCYAMDSDRLQRSSDLNGLLEEGWEAAAKPALLAYSTLAQLLGAAKFEEREALPNGQIYLLHFRRSDGRRVSVLWLAPGEAAFALPAAMAAAETFDMLGNRQAFRRGEKIPLNGRPLFFVQ